MSASALPGSRVEWYRAGMMATAVRRSEEEGPGDETGGTANITTAAQFAARSSPCSAILSLASLRSSPQVGRASRGPRAAAATIRCRPDASANRAAPLSPHSLPYAGAVERRRPRGAARCSPPHSPTEAADGPATASLGRRERRDPPRWPLKANATLKNRRRRALAVRNPFAFAERARAARALAAPAGRSRVERRPAAPPPSRRSSSSAMAETASTDGVCAPPSSRRSAENCSW